jgi:hypothetical protein
MVGIARGRSYASVLVIPRRKTSLCEALHGRRPWPDLKLHGSSWGAHWRGEGERGEGQRAGGLEGGMGGAVGAAWFGPCVLSVAVVREVLCSCVREGSRRKEKGEEKKKRKEKKKKRKKYGKFLKLEFF